MTEPCQEADTRQTKLTNNDMTFDRTGSAEHDGVGDRIKGSQQ